MLHFKTSIIKHTFNSQECFFLLLLNDDNDNNASDTDDDDNDDDVKSNHIFHRWLKCLVLMIMKHVKCHNQRTSTRAHLMHYHL